MADTDKFDWRITASFHDRIVKVWFHGRRASFDDEMLRVELFQQLESCRKRDNCVMTPYHVPVKAVPSNPSAIFALTLRLVDKVFEVEGTPPPMRPDDFDGDVIY